MDWNRLGCHANRYTVSRCCTRGESEDHTSGKACKDPSWLLRPRTDVTRSTKQGYQWPHEKDLCPQKFLLKKPSIDAPPLKNWHIKAKMPSIHKNDQEDSVSVLEECWLLPWNKRLSHNHKPTIVQKLMVVANNTHIIGNNSNNFNTKCEVKHHMIGKQSTFYFLFVAKIKLF